MPPTISALLAARLDNLTREERAVVEPASVIGLVFPEAAVEALVPQALQSTVRATSRTSTGSSSSTRSRPTTTRCSGSTTSSSGTRPTRAC